MSYQVHNFQPGDILLASQLNEMDEQIANISEEAGENTGVYYCTYGTTTSAEIETAYQAEMICLCEYNNLVYRLTGRADSTTHVFACTDGAAIYVLNVMDDTWISQYVDMSAYIEAPTATANQILYYDGSSWAAKAQTPEVTNSTAGAVSVALDPEKIYHFTGALTALTITLNAPASGDLAEYHFDFLSGSTAPTLTMPNTVTMPDSFTVEANKRYEVDVLNGYGAVMAW